MVTMNRPAKNPTGAKNGRFRLVIAFDSLTGGGAARVAAILGNAWVAKGLDVNLVISDDGSRAPAYWVHEQAKIFHTGLGRDSSSLLHAVAIHTSHIIRLRTALGSLKPDLIISFLDTLNVIVLLATRGLGIPVIVSERIDPAGWNLGRAWELLRRLTYQWADAVVCQGERPLRYFGPRLRRKGRIIPNPVALPTAAAGLRADVTCPRQVRTLVAMGSLRPQKGFDVPQKGFDVLLNAFSRVIPRHREWRLVIWGDGPLRSELESQASQLGIADHITFPGVTREPFARLAEADLFVLSSRLEGFPNVLTEAMSVGLPVIATDVGAVPEIVRDGIDGVLVPPGQVEALAVAMDRLMGNSEARSCLAVRAPDVLERFSLKKVIGMWEELICEVTGAKCGNHFETPDLGI